MSGLNFPSTRLAKLTPHLRAATLAAAIAVAEVFAGPVVARADNSITIPTISQQDGAWAGTPPGSSTTDTVGSEGCAITAVAMMLRHYGIDTDPGRFNGWLTANGGYAFDDQLIWAAVTTYFVLLTGYAANGGFVINDPWFADSVRFIDRYGDPSTGIVSIRTFMPADAAPRRGERDGWLATAVDAVHPAQ